MHKNSIVADITESGVVNIYQSDFLPYGLFLEEGTEGSFDDSMNNLVNFYAWLSSRVLTLDREYAKEILNSIGATQATNDRDRALFAIKYKALSLCDVYWVKENTENVLFEDVNLFDNHLSNAFVDVSLRGKQLTVTGNEFDADVATAGVFPKAWVRKESGFVLYKDGGVDVVNNEYISSKIAQCFNVPQVKYDLTEYALKVVTESRLITSKEFSIVPASDWNILLVNQDKDVVSEAIALDKHGYYMMNIVDYIIGNTDRHWNNWGVLVDNATNQAIRLYDLMDFNKSFEAFDGLTGGLCLTTGGLPITQQQAAVEAVRIIGLNLIEEPKKEWFENGNLEKYKIVMDRINYLKEI